MAGLSYVCAWCGKALDKPKGARADTAGGLVSHGICKPCAEALGREANLEMGADPMLADEDWGHK